MTLDACMRIEKHWNIERMVSGGGWHVAIVHARQKDRYRMLFCTPRQKWRWWLSAKMNLNTANSIMRKVQEGAHSGVGCAPALRNARQYSRTVYPSRFAKHRQKLRERLELREMSKNDSFGIF